MKQRNKQPKQQHQFFEAISASLGLIKVCEHGDTHIIGNTPYIAGADTHRDMYVDITKVPSSLLWPTSPTAL